MFTKTFILSARNNRQVFLNKRKKKKSQIFFTLDMFVAQHTLENPLFQVDNSAWDDDASSHFSAGRKI